MHDNISDPYQVTNPAILLPLGNHPAFVPCRALSQCKIPKRHR